jgi:hypothetical protein
MKSFFMIANFSDKNHDFIKTSFPMRRATLSICLVLGQLSHFQKEHQNCNPVLIR